MTQSVFDMLKKCEGQTLQLSYYDKESDMWVLVFDKDALLVDKLEEIAEPAAFMARTLENELPYAEVISRLSNIATARKEVAQKANEAATKQPDPIQGVNNEPTSN